MSDSPPNKADIIIKSITALTAVGTLLLAVINYGDTIKRESQKPFLEKQLATYSEAVGVVGKLATDTTAQGREELLTRFWGLYWSELAVVESPDVEAAMVVLGKTLRDDQTKNALPEPERRAYYKDLQEKSLRLAHAVRKSISEGWSYELPKLPDR